MWKAWPPPPGCVAIVFGPDRRGVARRRSVAIVLVAGARFRTITAIVAWFPYNTTVDHIESNYLNSLYINILMAF